MEILDCTLRDGGYYTNWDFGRGLVDSYIAAVNQLPIDIVEIGYRSPPQAHYRGEYFYCPQYAVDHIASICSKRLAIMLDEKDVRPDMLDDLLHGCDRIDTVRLAVDPDHFDRAIVLAKGIRLRGFKVAMNVMYMSDWGSKTRFLESIARVDEAADCLNMVDSYGGAYPEDVEAAFDALRKRTSVAIGFHGHNNLELGLINSLTALERGADIVDATISGMGRGAGNLRMELLLAALNSRSGLDVDFNALGTVVSLFEELKGRNGWGTNLPYMIAGSNSFSQKEVMQWVTNRFYSYNSVIRTLQNKKEGRQDNIKLPILSKDAEYSEVLIVGGGPSAIEHCAGIIEFLSINKSVAVIHASSKNVEPYEDLGNDQFFCLVGNEGHRLEKNFSGLDSFQGVCVLPPFPRKMGTYIPDALVSRACELERVSFTDSLLDTHTAIALQTAIDLGATRVHLVGYDGYSEGMTNTQNELSRENSALFDRASKTLAISSLLPTEYDLEIVSLYSELHERRHRGLPADQAGERKSG